MRQYICAVATEKQVKRKKKRKCDEMGEKKQQKSSDVADKAQSESESIKKEEGELSFVKASSSVKALQSNPIK